MRVSDLFNAATRQWHTQVLVSMFMPTTVIEIQLINLTETSNQDRLIWKENKKGAFSMKTAYRVALRLKQQEQVEHSSAQKDRRLWNRIWQLNIPPKVRNFVWRACSDILPYSHKLMSKESTTEPGLCNMPAT